MRGTSSAAASSTGMTQAQISGLKRQAADLQREEDRILQEAMQRPPKAQRRIQVDVTLE